MAHFDVVIIGSGAGGGTLAQRLAASGKTILILERGEQLPREAENWSPKAVFIEHRYRTQNSGSTSAASRSTEHPLLGRRQYDLLWRGLMRLRGRDFDVVEHAGGVSPAWPISLTDMAPYYAEAETLWRVHGSRGDDPTEEGKRAALRLRRRARRPGHRPAPGPLAEPGLAAVLPAARHQPRPRPHRGHRGLHQVARPAAAIRAC